MGYTHYWDQPQECFTRATFTLLQEMTAKIIDRAKALPEPIEVEIKEIDSPKIWLNGVDGESHDDFLLRRFVRGDGFDFCKTGSKPYDAIVVAVLIAAHICSYGKLQLSSDGNLCDWQAGLKLFALCFPKQIDSWNILVGENGGFKLEIVEEAKVDSIESAAEYLVVRLNHQNLARRITSKVVCPPSQLLDRINDLLEVRGERAYRSIADAIGSYADKNSTMTIVDLQTLDFVD